MVIIKKGEAMKTPRKKNKKMQFRKVKVGFKDKYPEIDCYIDDAAIVADQKAKLVGSDKEWNFWFMSAMDDALSRVGLRVL